MKTDIIIIGSGLGGLECAHILARKGMSVKVLERQTQAGGCLQSYCRNGRRFDTGLHYVGGLGEGQHLHKAFSDLNLLRLPWHHLDAEGFDLVTIEGRTFPFAEGYGRFANTLAEYFPKERHALVKYTEMLRNTAETWNDSFDSSAYAYLTETFSDDMLINVLSGTSIKMELQRETLPLFNFAHGTASYIESSWRLKGDGNMIVDSLSDDIRNYGGEILCRAEVSELIEKDGKIVAARCTNGETYEADIFISNAHPAVTFELIKESSVLKRIFRRRINNMANTFGIFTVQLVIKPGTIKYFNHNKYVYRKPNVWTFFENDSPTGGLMISARVPEDGSDYVSQIDLLTPMCWEQCRRWSNTTVGHRDSDYLEFKKKKTDECITLAATVLPQLNDAVSEIYTSSPLTYRDYNNTPDGSAFGTRKDYHNIIMTMLSPRTPISNLFLTGQNLMLHGLEGVTMTAYQTTSQILNDYNKNQ